MKLRGDRSSEMGILTRRREVIEVSPQHLLAEAAQSEAVGSVKLARSSSVKAVETPPPRGCASSYSKMHPRGVPGVQWSWRCQHKSAK